MGISLNRKLLTFGAAYTFGAVAQKGIGFLIFLFLAERLSTFEYAKFGLGYAAFSAFGAFASAGIYESIIRQYLGKTETQRSELFRVANAAFLFNALLLSIISVGLILLFDFSDFGSFVEILMILIGGLFSAFFLTQANIYRLKELHKVAIGYLVLPPLISYIFGFVAVLLFNTSLAFFTGSGVGFILSYLIYSLGKVVRIGFYFDSLFIKKLMKGALPFLLIAIIDWLSGYGNSFFIDAIFDKEKVAFYVFAYTIASIIQLLASSMNQVWSPRFVALFDQIDNYNLQSKYKLFGLSQGLVLGLAGALIILVYSPITSTLNVLQDYQEIQRPLFYLFAGYIACISLWQAQNYFVVQKAGALLMRVTFFSGIMGLSSWWLFMTNFPLHGIYTGFLVYMLIRTISASYVARKRWRVKFLWQGTLLGWSILIISLMLV